MTRACLADADEDVPDVRAGALRVGGIVPFSAIDYPGRLAAVVFCRGCPWRCGYCHNAHLQDASDAAGLRWADIRAWLETRRGLLDAVVFSGGEPTAQPGLRAAMDDTRAQGYAIGLHTAGIYPRRLASLLPGLDWLGFDLKADAAGYDRVTGRQGSARLAFASLEAVLQARVPVEIRTTVHPAATPADGLRRLAATLAARGITRWVLQQARISGGSREPVVESVDFPSAALLAELQSAVPGIIVR